MSEINLSTNVLIDELAIRQLTDEDKKQLNDILDNNISDYNTNVLIDELENRFLSSSQEREILNICGHTCEISSIQDFELSEILDGIEGKGMKLNRKYMMPENLLDEQKVTLMNTYFDVFKLDELESLFEYGFNKFYKEL